MRRNQNGFVSEINVIQSSIGEGLLPKKQGPNMKIDGHCLCRNVEFSFSAKTKTFGSCHCSMCRRWSGGPAMAVEAEGTVKFKDDKFVKIYSSSDWAERGFCSSCGTHLFYRLKDGKFWNIPLGVLDDQSEFKFALQVYIDHKPEHYSFANKTEMMTEEDVLKAFGVTS